MSSQIVSNPSEFEKSYGMFSNEGNFWVDQICILANLLNLKWSDIESELELLAQKPKFSEAQDTAVREAVWIELTDCGMTF